ncbi:DUF167 family protein [Sphingomonas sp. S2-65]|uniref:DUF167 family protein n=1 Tax=Sphingomonas sp. S2-65 TaxID=2903960 RepID=UPI001F42BBE8|nr:DUF167 family protein [Sphingomonas sp. S2-65]UYY57600.1 DUF167 family protein [Sphingomonas sp. S2-65]
MSAWRRRADGIEIAVRVTARGSRDVLGAGTDEHFAARLSAPPVDGAANAALVALVAERFGVPRRAVRLVAGDTARLKRLAVSGDAQKLEQIARSLYGGTHDG